MIRTLAFLALLLLPCTALAAEDDAACLDCHADREKLAASRKEDAKPVERLLLDRERYARSVHAARGCAECHFDYEEQPHPEDAESVTCGDCHDAAVKSYSESVHGRLRENGTTHEVATCADCHGVHDILPPSDRQSRLNPLNVYQVCGQCHFSVDPATATVEEMLTDPYTDDAHARGILLDGLRVSATCVSCHGGHEIRAEGDPSSRTSRINVAETCGDCHVGILEQYRESVHHLRSEGPGHKGATCSDCHPHHQISRPDANFRNRVVSTCSNCHEQRNGTFRSSYHGKRTTLGIDEEIATCSSCHGAHRILPSDSPESRIHPDNIVRTCGRCHEESHEEFTRYIVHADINDPVRFPTLNLIYRVMSGLLTVVLILGGIHILLWLVRSLAAGEWRRPPRPADTRFVRRWPRSYIFYHIALMTCVLMLASTGLPLHYADRPWATRLMNMIGGVVAAGYVHRVFAVGMVTLFFAHLVHIAFRFLVQRERGLFFGPYTMLPRFKDLQDLIGNFRWFFFRGARPKYGRWTYWEKFDYWAVFWGIFVIGLSGLILWFPEKATRYVPGWFVNAAVIVHGIEALLDLAFIFSVHIFHANLRPDKFPMDTMFFSGRMTEEEFRHERPEEYELALQEGRIENMLARTPAARTRILAYVIGTAAMLVGFAFVVAMIVALIQG